jgi:EamA-like transporter family
LPARRRVGNGGEPDELAAVLDVEGRGAGGAGPVDRGQAPPGITKEPRDRRGGGRAADAVAHDLALVVDAQGKVTWAPGTEKVVNRPGPAGTRESARRRRSCPFSVAILAVIPAARRGVPRSDWPAIALLGTVWMAVPFVLFPVAEQWIDSSLAGMLGAAAPLFTALVATLVARQLPGARQRAGLLLLAPPGLASVPASSIAWSSLLAVAALGSLGTALAYAAFTTLVGRVGSTRASVSVYFLPVVAIALGALFRDEAITAASVLGTGLVAAGAYLTSRKERHTTPSASGSSPAAAPAATPSSTQSAVLVGHLDTRTDPDVFSRLGELRPGDELLVGRADGTTARSWSAAWNAIPRPPCPPAGSGPRPTGPCSG